jgi:exopolysaccharide production protein ExoQ
MPGYPDVAGGPERDWKRRSLLRYMTVIDPAAMVFWVMGTTLVNIPIFGPIRYLLVAYFMVGLVVHFRDTLPRFMRGWPTLIIPIMCVISALWAPSANEAIRKGIFMFLTGAVACYAATRLSIRQIITVYFLGEILGCLLSLKTPTPVDGNWTGVFGQKNHLAVHMFILYTTAFVIMLDKGSNKFLRLFAATFVPVTAFMIFMAHSATTLLMVGASAMAFIGHQFLWEPASRIRHARTLLVFAMALLGSLAVLVLFGLLQLDAMDTVLKAFGKDSTLTGRTWLWAIAERQMAENPLTGVGAAGFWRSESGLANQITTFFFYATYVKFSFHNSYLENGVQLGYPGYYATFFLVAWGMFNIVRTWLRNQTLMNAAMMILAITVVIRSNAEIDFALELAGTAILFFIGAMRIEKPRHATEPPPLSEAPMPAPGYTATQPSPGYYRR